MRYTTERPDSLEAASRGRVPARRAAGGPAKGRGVAGKRRGNGRAAARMFAGVAFVAGAFGFFVYAIAATSDIEFATVSVDQAATAPAAAVTSVAERAPASTVATKTVAKAAAAPKADVLAYRPLSAHSPLLNANYSLGVSPTVIGSSVRVSSAFEQALADSKAAADPQMVAALPQAPLPPQRPDSSQRVANIPLPMARPGAAKAGDVKAGDTKAADAAGPSKQEIAESSSEVALAKPAPEKDSIFQKLFGSFKGGSVLAFAAPDGGIFSDGSSMTPGKYDRQTAVYDISAKTVYLPDGRKLEAHSGLGSRLDDPRFVHERMRGSTPPHIYDLTLREKPFHGVRAIRLNPVGGSAAVFGRTGLLAHTYMLGPNGDSNGCVSLRNYDAFLRAFESGQIKRLAVVAKLS